MTRLLQHLPAAAAVAGTEIALRLLPLHRACRLLGVRPAFDRPPVTTGGVPAGAEGAVRRVSAVLRRCPWPATCLRRALAVGVLLRGSRPVLHVGVRPGSDGLRAHAWLVVGGVVVVEGEGAEDFVALRRAAELPAAG